MSKNDNNSNILLAALVGAAAGAVAGLLLAPESGKKTRKKLKKKGDKLKKEATQNLEDIAAKGNEVFDELRKQSTSLKEQANDFIKSK